MEHSIPSSLADAISAVEDRLGPDSELLRILLNQIVVDVRDSVSCAVCHLDYKEQAQVFFKVSDWMSSHLSVD